MVKSNLYRSLAVAGALALAYAPTSAKAGDEGVLTITKGDKVVSLGGIESEFFAMKTVPTGQVHLYTTPKDLAKVVDLNSDGKLTGLEKELGFLVANTSSAVGGIPEKIEFRVGGVTYNLMTMKGLEGLKDFDKGYFVGIKDDVGFSTKFKEDSELLRALDLQELVNDFGGGDGGDGDGNGDSGSAGSSGGGASGGSGI